MNNITTRLCVVAALIVGAWGVNHWLRSSTVPNDVEFPAWSIEELPYQLGNWRGEDIKMDSTITAAIGAAVVIERTYQIEKEQPVALHSAMFKNPNDGVYHSPLNCYAANGWKKISDSTENVQVADNLNASVRLVGWEKEGERVLVAFWYQLGEHMLHDRFDLGKVRLQMRGKSEWPALIKVMAQTSLTDPQQAQKTLLDFTKTIGTWLNQPDHQKYLARWGGV
jgi:EpsI family protein